ncbi:MAG TPA: hypothetical protein VE758_02245 [Chthoniobacterales bacterium]|nr:hypothetical protein [Chthoniobacterales bacterium]
MKLIAAILLFAFALSGCATPQMKAEKEKKAAAAAKKAKVKPSEEPTEVDFQAFVGRLRKAVAAHDVQTLATMMTSDFGYRLEPEASGEGVFQYWDEHGLWPELQGILSEKFVKKGDYMVAPPQFANPALNYDGYRAGIRRINGSWKFAYFVNG